MPKLLCRLYSFRAVRLKEYYWVLHQNIRENLTNQEHRQKTKAEKLNHITNGH